MKIKITLLMLFLITFLMSSSVSSQIFSPDTKIFRPLFDLPYDFILEQSDTSGTITLPEGVNLSAVEKFRYTVRGCMNETTGQRQIFINGKFYGNTGFNTCENLFFEGFQHFDEKVVERETIGSFSIDSKIIEWNVIDSGFGKPPVIIQEHRITFIEKVACTRSSQCPAIRVGNDVIQSICSQKFHQCSLRLPSGETRPVEPDDEVVTTPTTNIVLIIILILAVGGGWLLFKKKRKRR